MNNITKKLGLAGLVLSLTTSSLLAGMNPCSPTSPLNPMNPASPFSPMNPGHPMSLMNPLNPIGFYNYNKRSNKEDLTNNPVSYITNLYWENTNQKNLTNIPKESKKEKWGGMYLCAGFCLALGLGIAWGIYSNKPKSE